MKSRNGRFARSNGIRMNPADSDPANSYEDDYEELYESFHD